MSNITMSDSIKHLTKALSLFHIKMSPVKKDSKNPFFNSSYASLHTILEAISDPLAEAGLTFTQFPVGENGLCTIIAHADSGEYIMSEYTMRPTKDDPQGRGSAITYQRRYALGAVLGINIEEDDDANKASTPQAPQQRPDDGRQWLNENTENYSNVVKALQSGTYTIADVERKYKLSKTIKAKLLEL
jgi:hypothetical protein